MNKSYTIKHPAKQKKFILLIFLLSIFILLFTVIKTYTNVYANAFIGALFEMAWLPWFLGLFILPLITLWHIYKTKTPLFSLINFSLVLQITGILILIFN